MLTIFVELLDRRVEKQLVVSNRTSFKENRLNIQQLLEPDIFSRKVEEEVTIFDLDYNKNKDK